MFLDMRVVIYNIEVNGSKYDKNINKISVGSSASLRDKPR